MLGLVVGFALSFLVELINYTVFPLPLGTDFKNPELYRAAMQTLPPASLALTLAGWLLRTAAGCYAAARIARGREAPIVLGILLLGGAIGTMRSFPHPIWFWIIGVVVHPVGVWLGAVKRTA